nr:ice-binding family protein [uncultured Mucilaginibacter sp.]
MKKISTLNMSGTRLKGRGLGRILYAIAFIALAVVSACKKDTYKPTEGLCPVVVATDPANKAVDVALNKIISVTFNTAMDSLSIKGGSFTIKQGANVITGKVSTTADNKVFTFKPDVALLPFLVYTGTVTKKATDVFHTAMVDDYVWTFTTIPLVTITAAPVLGGVVTGGGSFAQGSVATVTATPNTGFTFVNWTVNGTAVSTSSSYPFTIAGNSTLVANFAAIPAGNFAVVLSSAPAAGGTTTGSGAYASGSTATVTATPNPGYTFKNWTDGATIVSTSSSYQFTITGNRTLVANYTVIPASQLALVLSSSPAIGGSTSGSGAYSSGTSVTAVASPNIGYAFLNWTENGNTVSTSASYTFAITANRTLVANFAAPAIGPGQVNLGLAGNYNMLTKTGITTTGVTSIQGDLGVSPAAATSITGFGLIMDASGTFSKTPIVTGKVYAADYAAPTPANLTTAVSNMETAFTTANNLVTPAPIVDLYAGDLSGRILPPGLYKYNTGVLITNAGVTLSGSANDTWVIQIAQDLTINNSAKITLLGGAQAKNIVWVVAGQATLGTNVDFSGILLSKTLISLQAGAKVTGRLLAQTAVTLNNNIVVLP